MSGTSYLELAERVAQKVYTLSESYDSYGLASSAPSLTRSKPASASLTRSNSYGLASFVQEEETAQTSYRAVAGLLIPVLKTQVSDEAAANREKIISGLKKTAEQATATQSQMRIVM